jgi:hypothetical protein
MPFAESAQRCDAGVAGESKVETPSIPVSKDDARFVKEVDGVLEQRLPNLVRLEKYLSIFVLVATLLGALAALGLAVWAGRILWQREQEDYIKTTVRTLEQDASGPLGLLSKSVSNMSKTLSSTFETQVDSATFKVLKFGCAAGPAAEATGIRRCSTTKSLAGALQAQEDQTILLVANPKQQIVRLDLSLYPIRDVGPLEPLLLQIYAEPPPMRADGRTTRTMLSLKPSQVGPNESEFVQDGRLRLIGPSLGSLRATIDLTPALVNLQITGPILLRFVVTKESTERLTEVPASSAALKAYDTTSGTEVFFVRTIISAYHKLPDTVASK